MNPREFEEVVRTALEQLPPQFHRALENVAVVVEDEPDPDDLAEVELESDTELLGLYIGTPLTEREAAYTGLPDRVVIYRLPMLRSFDRHDELVSEIQKTVIHELGHHMGLSDEEMPY